MWNEVQQALRGVKQPVAIHHQVFMVLVAFISIYLGLWVLHLLYAAKHYVFLVIAMAPLLLAAGIMLILLGAAAGWWIEKQIRLQVRRRRLKKVGFSSADLTSKEGFFKKWGEITAAKIPQRISFDEVASHSWSEPAKYEQSKAAFELLGFKRSSTFVASPQKWIVEFWLSPWPRVWAKIIDSSVRGVYSEVSLMNADGSTSSFENTEECGLQHRESDRWVHCGLIAPAQLVERVLREGTPEKGEPMKLAEYVSAYEQSVNEYLAWRRSVGISADEMKRTFALRKKRRSRV